MESAQSEILGKGVGQLPAPLVSVVIPSYQRYELVIRAVRSALEQTLAPLEVVVCNDGPDSKKKHLLAKLGDSRVRYIEAPWCVNASATRNYGVRHAKGEWIALLDDDDVWLPKKLQAQFSALRCSGLLEAVLAGAEAVYHGKTKSRTRPAHAIPLHVAMDQVLFCGYGGAHTSTLVAPKWLFEKYPFDEHLTRHEDWSWMLQAGKDMELVVAPEVVCQRFLGSREGLSRPGGYNVSKTWYVEYKRWMGAKARASFVTNILSSKAAYDMNVSALPWLIGELRNNAGLGRKNMARLGLPWLVPSSLRQTIKARLAKP